MLAFIQPTTVDKEPNRKEKELNPSLSDDSTLSF